MAALLGAGTLVLDVVARYARFDEAANEVAHVGGITTVAGVRVGDDERPVVHRRRRCRKLFGGGHLQPQVVLVAVGGQQGAHQSGGFVGHLAEGIAGEVGPPRVLADRPPLRRGGPATEVDALMPIRFITTAWPGE